MIKPITKEQVHSQGLPDLVIAAVNKILLDGDERSFVTVHKIKSHMQAIQDLEDYSPLPDNFKPSLDNIKKLYENNGWTVHLDTPSYNEFYLPYLSFS